MLRQRARRAAVLMSFRMRFSKTVRYTPLELRLNLLDKYAYPVWYNMGVRIIS